MDLKIEKGIVLCVEQEPGCDVAIHDFIDHLIKRHEGLEWCPGKYNVGRLPIMFDDIFGFFKKLLLYDEEESSLEIPIVVKGEILWVKIIIKRIDENRFEIKHANIVKLGKC